MNFIIFIAFIVFIVFTFLFFLLLLLLFLFRSPLWLLFFIAFGHCFYFYFYAVLTIITFTVIIFFKGINFTIKATKNIVHWKYETVIFMCGFLYSDIAVTFNM